MTGIGAEQALALGAAVAAGLLVGVERGWKLRDEPGGSRVAGIRTFTLLGMAGGLAGTIARAGAEAAAGVIALGAAIAVLIGHWRQAEGSGRGDATSAVAAMVTVGLGMIAGLGEPGLAVAGAALVTLLLALRQEMHRLVGRLDEADVKALARFAVIALAVLPFLPDRAMGPYDAWNPAHLWWVVVLVTGFSFAGYVANRLVGARHGTIATAVIGGAYSSTAVTQSLAQRIGAGKAGGAEQAGIALASGVMYLRVLLLVAVLATPLLRPFAIIISPPLVLAWIAGWWLMRTAPRSAGPAPPGNPIALVPALGFLLFVAVAAVAAQWAQAQFGDRGIAILLLVMGTLDVDAAIVTAGSLRPGSIAPELAALAVAGTILANMAVKLGVTLAYARRQGRRAALALLISMVGLAASLAVGYAGLGLPGS